MFVIHARQFRRKKLTESGTCLVTASRAGPSRAEPSRANGANGAVQGTHLSVILTSMAMSSKYGPVPVSASCSCASDGVVGLKSERARDNWCSDARKRQCSHDIGQVQRSLGEVGQHREFAPTLSRCTTQRLPNRMLQLLRRGLLKKRLHPTAAN